MPDKVDTRKIASHFLLDGRFVSAHRFGSGHINDTFHFRSDGDGLHALGWFAVTAASGAIAFVLHIGRK